MGRGVGYRAEDRGTTPLCSWRDLASICSALSAYLTLGRRRCQLLLIFAECSSGARKPTRYFLWGREGVQRGLWRDVSHPCPFGHRPAEGKPYLWVARKYTQSP